MVKRSGRPTFFELLNQSLHSVEGGYNLLAPKFDKSPYKTPEEILIPFFRYIGREHRFATGLDLCCGTGAATLHLAQICDRVTGLDLSEGMLAQCQTKLNKAGYSDRVELIKGDALELTFESEFDVVVSFGAFGHILPQDEIRLLEGVFRSLRPGGVFYFITTAALPTFSLSNLIQRIFNGIMRVRNRLIRPKFIMYYLTFRLPEVQQKLSEAGYEITIKDDLQFDRRFNYLIPLKHFRLVAARKPTDWVQSDPRDFHRDL